MKLNIVPTSIALALSALIAYGFYTYGTAESNMILGIGGFFFVAIPLSLALGYQSDYPRSSANIKVISSVFFLLSIAENIIFTSFAMTIPSFIIINGLTMLVLILIVYSINKAKQ
jgi:hypothetical protein